MGNFNSTNQISDKDVGNKSLALEHQMLPLYGLVDVTDPHKGELVVVARRAMETRNFAAIDDFIQDQLPGFLLNEGKGDMVPLKEILKIRNSTLKAKYKSEFTTSRMKSFIFSKKNKDKTQDSSELLEIDKRYVCFDHHKRSRTGETVLTLCLLHGSSVHKLIAHKLIKNFPGLVRDIDISDEKYGQSALHLAVVGEDLELMRMLLNNNADIHQRCIGRIFLPDDQQSSYSCAKIEYPRLAASTNYKGISYFGEYPLSFAAVFNLEDCVRLLMAYGADPNKQDSNGNTVLHMMVINDNIKMFKLLASYQASTGIKNNQDLTPLTLAAKLARKDIFFFILEHSNVSFYTYADISCSAYPVKYLDTIMQNDGRTDMQSALYIILMENDHEHLDLLHGVLFELLTLKWNGYVKYRFYFEFALYIIFYLLTAICIFLRRTYYDYLVGHDCVNESSHGNHLSDTCHCAYLYPTDNLRYARAFFEITVYMFTLFFIVTTVMDVALTSPRVYLRSVYSNPTKVLFLIALVFIIICLPLRLACNVYGEDILSTMVVIILGIYSLYFGRGFRSICTFVYNIHLILKTNILQFAIVYIIFLAGFSQSFYINLNFLLPFFESKHQHVFDTWFHSFVDTFVMTLAESPVEYDLLNFKSSYSIVGWIYTTIYFFVGPVLLVMILIASMDYTQEQTNDDRPTEWIRQWGKIMLAIEFRLTKSERIKQLNRYTNVLLNGEKGIIIKWKNTQKDRKNGKDIFQKNAINIQAMPKL